MADDEMFIRWQHVRVDELMALHRVALEAREAVQIAADAGVHLGPLRAALDKTAYRVGSPFEKTPEHPEHPDEATRQLALQRLREEAGP